MRGPLPKDPALRQRRNKATTRATLSAVARIRRPALPERSEGLEWQKLTLQWWRDVWRSPMAAEYLQADIHALFRLAVLIDMFWLGPSKELAAEIAKEQQAFGLSPLDRRRLEWEIEKVEAVARNKRPPAPSHREGDDPRRLLSIV